MKSGYLAVVIALGFSVSGLAQNEQKQKLVPPVQDAVVVRGVDSEQHRITVMNGTKFLLEKGQAADGSFSKQLGPAVTAMCTSALIRNGVPVNNPKIQKALTYLEGFIQKDGGVYPKGSNLQNYETSVAIMCFKNANVNGKYDQQIEKAAEFLKVLQWDGGEGHSITSSHFGGAGYGSHQRPDASNTQFMIDALIAAGVDPKSTSIQNATKFMSRTQNLNSPHNGLEFSTKTTADDKGGFIYTPVGPESKAGETPEGGLRSYASMTYAGLKSFLYAGVKKDDIRVKAAMDWISRHYDLKTNPGMGQQGLYYYYHVFAKALDANGTRVIKDSNGVEHNWRADLTAQLSSTQKSDGSWTNEADRWYEGDPNLVTSYSLLALSYCSPKKDK